MSLLNFKEKIQLINRLAIRELPESDHKIWDDLVRNSNQDTILHQFDW